MAKASNMETAPILTTVIHPLLSSVLFHIQ